MSLTRWRGRHNGVSATPGGGVVWAPIEIHACEIEVMHNMGYWSTESRNTQLASILKTMKELSE